jgi:hypothetical protein
MSQSNFNSLAVGRLSIRSGISLLLMFMC